MRTSARVAVRLLVVLNALVAAAAAHAGTTADLGVAQTAPATTTADADVAFDLTMTNGGPDAAMTAVLDDPLPAGMTFVSATQNSGPAFSCTTPAIGGAGSVNCTIATLATSTTATFTFTFHTDPATPPNTFFTNIATVSSATFDPNDENNSGAAATFVPPTTQADLFVTKVGPNAAGPDTDVVYTITTGNAGPDDATAFSLTDPLPGTMTFVSLVQNSGPALSCTTPAGGSGGTITCTAATFPSGASATLTLTGHIPPGTGSGTQFNNMAAVSSATVDSNNENDNASFTVTVSAVDVSATKGGPASVVAGSTITYMLMLANAGPDPAQNATLTDPLPAGTTFQSLTQNTGPTANCQTPASGATGTVTCSIGLLGNGASATFTLVVAVGGNVASVTNTATASTDSFDTAPSNDSASAMTTVVASADVAIVKSGPTTVAAGNTLSYMLTVSNAGPSDAASVSLSDVLPAGTTFVSLSQTSGPTFACTTGATVTCNIATLAAGSSAVFTLVVRSASSTASGSAISNTATVATTTSDPNAANNSSTSTATTTVSADLALTKSGPGVASAGTDIAYALTAHDNGPSDAVTVALTDPLPSGTTFASLTQTSGPAFTCATPAPGASGTVTCTIASFAAGATAAFNLVVHVLPTAVGSVANTASIASPSDPNGANNAASAITSIGATSIPALGPAGMLAMLLALLCAAAPQLRARRR